VQKPSADAFLEAFDNRFYVPVAPPVVGAMEFRWGAYDGRATKLGMILSVGRKRERVLVQASASPESTTVIVHDLLFHELTRPFRFPIVVDRGKAHVRVEDRDRVFTTYTYRANTVATAVIRDLAVMVGCRTHVLRSVRLGVLTPEEFRRLFRASERRIRDQLPDVAG